MLKRWGRLNETNITCITKKVLNFLDSFEIVYNGTELK